MANEHFSKKSRPIILGIFAVVGFGLGFGLTATGIFASFTLLGLIGMGFLLFLASIGVGALINELIKGIEDFVQSRNQITPVTPDDPLKQQGMNILSPSNPKLSASPLVTPPTPKTKTKQELQTDAQRVQKYFAEEFALATVTKARSADTKTKVEQIRFGGDRRSEPLHLFLKQNVHIVEKNGSFGIQIHETWGGFSDNWLSQTFQANVPKGNPMDHLPKQPIKKLVDLINEEFGQDTAQIVPELSEYKTTYRYRYPIEIGPDKIPEVLRQINSAQQDLKPT